MAKAWRLTLRLRLVLITFLATLAAIPPAPALERPIDMSKDRWVQVSEHGATQNDISCAYPTKTP
jgi:hypothetical protein